MILQSCCAWLFDSHDYDHLLPSMGEDLLTPNYSSGYGKQFIVEVHRLS